MTEPAQKLSFLSPSEAHLICDRAKIQTIASALFFALVALVGYIARLPAVAAAAVLMCWAVSQVVIFGLMSRRLRLNSRARRQGAIVDALKRGLGRKARLP